VDIALAEEAITNDIKDISDQSVTPVHYTKQRGYMSDEGRKRH